MLAKLILVLQSAYGSLFINFLLGLLQPHRGVFQFRSNGLVCVCPHARTCPVTSRVSSWKPLSPLCSLQQWDLWGTKPTSCLWATPKGDGSIINPKLGSLNRAIHQLGKSADSILRLLKSNEIVLESSLQKRLLEHKNLDDHSKKSLNSSVRLVLCTRIGAHVG